MSLVVILIITFACCNLTTWITHNQKALDADSPASITEVPEESTDIIILPTEEPIELVTEDEASVEDAPTLPEVTPEPDMDPDTWDYIRGGDYNMLYTEKEETPKVMPYEVHVNKQMNCITVYKRTKKGTYTKAVKSMVCSAGTDTPLGTFQTSNKYYWKAMIHDVWAQYATRITGQILFHSVPYETHEKDTLITNYYNRLGSTASAGCIRLSVIDAKWLMENCPSGTTVVISNSSDPGPLGKPSALRIPLNCVWDPTDPDTRNPWNSGETTITGVKDRTIERGSKVDFYSGIIAYDIFSNQMSKDNIKITTKLDVSELGEYKVKYSYTDSNGKTVKEKAIYTVVDTTGPTIAGIADTLYTKDVSTITEASILKMITVTDNGYPLNKDEVASITMNPSAISIQAKDEYGNETTKSISIIEDAKPPIIELKKNLEYEYPISEIITEKWAKKRLSKVTDNVDKINTDAVSIQCKPSGWGIKITYTAKDKAGNSTTVKETIAFEKINVEIYSKHLVVDDISDNDELADNISVYSESTGEDVDYSLKVKKEKLETNEDFKIYDVTYHITYKSSAGSKTITKTITAKMPR